MGMSLRGNGLYICSSDLQAFLSGARPVRGTGLSWDPALRPLRGSTLESSQISCLGKSLIFPVEESLWMWGKGQSTKWESRSLGSSP